jgi:diacylglycerol kinase (ATP)
MKGAPQDESQPDADSTERREDGDAHGGWLAIINPHAGPLRGREWYAALGRRLEEQLGADVLVSSDEDEAAERMAASPAAQGLAVFGGDGTIAGVVNRMDLNRQCLLPLPGGSGNGLARDLELTSVDRALDAWRAHRLATIDLVEATLVTGSIQVRRLVISTSSLGYATDTVIRAKAMRRDLGSLRYPIASLVQAIRSPVHTLNVALDGTPPSPMRLTNLMVNNTRYAGNFPVFRNASLSDGRMDVLLAANGFWQQALHNLGLLSHIYFYVPGRELSTDELRVRLPAPMRVMLDGEICENVREVHFAACSQQLRCYGWQQESAE